MKKQYKSLEVKVISLSKTDLITTSAKEKNSLLGASFDLGNLDTQLF